jgi:hypothetical protein
MKLFRFAHEIDKLTGEGTLGLRTCLGLASVLLFRRLPSRGWETGGVVRGVDKISDLSLECHECLAT